MYFLDMIMYWCWYWSMMHWYGLSTAPIPGSFPAQYQRVWSWSNEPKVLQISCTKKVIYEHGAVKRACRRNVTGESPSVLRALRHVCFQGLHFAHKSRYNSCQCHDILNISQHEDFIIRSAWQQPIFQQMLTGQILLSELSYQIEFFSVFKSNLPEAMFQVWCQ